MRQKITLDLAERIAAIKHKGKDQGDSGRSVRDSNISGSLNRASNSRALYMDNGCVTDGVEGSAGRSAKSAGANTEPCQGRLAHVHYYGE